MSKLVRVDVDGTLTKGENHYWEGECEPDKEMIDRVRELYKSGHYIVIWTARPWSNAKELVAWLKKHDVWYHGIDMEKGGADTYIDDKTIRPEEAKNGEPLGSGN